MKKRALILLFISTFCLNGLSYSKNLKTSTHVEWARLNAKSVAFYKQGDCALAIAAAQNALQIVEDEVGYNHPIVAKSLNNLGLLYKTQGRYSDAEINYKYSISILQTAEEQDLEAIAASLNNLAALYDGQGKYEEAEKYYKQALSSKIKLFGTSHLSVALIVLNIADLYCTQKKYEDAEPLFEHVIAIRERKLGSLHPLVAEGLRKLANLYYVQENYSKAEPLYSRALQIIEKTPLKSKTDLLSILDNLSVIYDKTNRQEEAAKLKDKTSEIRSK